MEAGQVLLVVVYLWLAVSIGVYGWRAFRRVVHGETRRDRAELRRPGAADDVDAGAAPPVDPGRRGMFAPRPGDPRDVTPRRPVAELVKGMVLPCELVPLVDDRDLDDHRAVFATTGRDAGAVGSALADELERLGYTVHSLTDSIAVARRDETELRMELSTRPGGDDGDRIVVELSS